VIVEDREAMKKQGYSPISGAYYSARLAVCEHLKSIRRSARVIVLRHISSDYWAPLGTWVIREAARKAMASPSDSCDSLDAATAVASARIGFDYWQQHSTLIPEMRTQRTLFSF
jgi:DNA repair protein NreA